jgi:hypothetical protein
LPNGLIAVCDQQGQQIGELQDESDETLEQIRARIDEFTIFETVSGTISADQWFAAVRRRRSKLGRDASNKLLVERRPR